VDTWQGLLRASIASAGNDHRLGANEAPPAIISVFLGEVLTDLFDQIQKGNVTGAKTGGELDTGVSFLPKLPRDAGDRNRTSPFAFTGNKFEFRAVSSGQSIAMPNICLNMAVTDALDVIATGLEAAVKAGAQAEAAAWEMLPSIITKHKRIIFNGNNYSDEWQHEAARRGLLNLRNTVDALPELVRPDVIRVFEKHKVLNERELRARTEINFEAYNKTINVEAQLMVLMANRYIVPAAIKYQTDVARSVAAVQDAMRMAVEVGVGALPVSMGSNGAPGEQTRRLLEQVSTLIDSLKVRADDLAHKLEHNGRSVEDHARHVRDTVVPAMAALREAGDALELLIPHGDWPLPTYREMLFIK
jgi:glutamine synthetase